MMHPSTHSSNPWRLSLCLLFVAVLALTFVGCGGDEPEEVEVGEVEMTVEEEPAAMDEEAIAMAELMDPSGKSLGIVEFYDSADGVRVEATLSGLEGSSMHGFHIHENGVCEADFSSAGGHFNPTGAVHACPPDPRHAGDMGNLELVAGGATFEYTSTDISLGAGANSVMGKAIVLHAGADDCQSQPSGAAGDRLACGVIAMAQPMAQETIEVEPGDGMDEGGDGY